MRAWLMMVSMAMAVLPVLRSPMMSSRWPRPIGIIESIEMMPVSNGWLTDLRAMMPRRSSRRDRISLASIGPLPDGRASKGVDYAAEQGLADGDGEEAAGGGVALVAFLELGDIA